MSVNCREILNAALQLSDEDRGIVVARLLETLSPDDLDLSDNDLEMELERRLDEAHDNPATTVSWTELREER